MRKGLIIFLCAGLWLIPISSCKTVKSGKESEVSHKTAEFLLRQLNDRSFKHVSFSAGFSASFNTGGRNRSFNGQVRFHKDSVIWVSITPALGIEVFRMLLTPDSVFILNRLERNYVRGGFRELNALVGTNLDFDILQSLIIASDIETYVTENFIAGTDNSLHHLRDPARVKKAEHIKPGHSHLVFSHEMWIEGDTYRIKKTKLDFHGQKGIGIMAVYDKHPSGDDSGIPSEQYYKLYGLDELALSLSFERIKYGDVLSFPFSIPKSYKPMWSTGR